MSLALPALLGALGGGPRRLVAPGALDPVLGFARAQVNTRSTSLAADGATWQEYLADEPRFHGTGRRLLLAGQRGNGIRNPRGEGAVPGIIGGGGALAANWSASAGGLAAEVVSTALADGVNLLRLRFNGTATASSGQILFEPNTQILAAPSQPWSGSLFARLVAAPAAPLAHRQFIYGRTSTGVLVAGNGFVAAFSPGPLLGRFVHAATLTADATIARVQPAYNWTMTIGQAYDWTIEIGWPQLEQGAFASLPILPPPGSPQASTRGTEQLGAGLAALGIGAGGACTLLVSALLPQAAPAGATQALLQLDDGGNTARFAVENPAGGSALRLAAGANTASLGAITPGTPFRIALAIDGAGRIAASLNGAAAIAATGGPTAGLTTLRIGSQAGGTNPAFGEFGLVAMLPFATPDAALPSLAATIPA